MRNEPIIRTQVMRTLALLALVLPSLSWWEASAQTTPCPTANYVLRSQGEVNGFPSGCSEITGNLTIGSSTNITDLSPLAAVNVIGNSLNIRQNSRLESLDGLAGVTSIGQDLWIMWNEVLAEINALSGLKSARGIMIMSNDVLANIDGLSSLAAAGSITISDNSEVANIDGFSGLTSLHIGASIGVVRNHALTNVNGLSGLTEITGSLTIGDNASLTNLDGISGISLVGSSLDISRNAGLTNINALSQLTEVGGPLTISENQALVSCSCGLYACLSANCVGGSITMSANAASGDCNNDGADLQENACNPTVGLERESTAQTAFALHPAHPNPFNPATTIRYDVPEPAEVRLIVFDALGRMVSDLGTRHLAPGTHSVVWDASTRPSGMYFIRMEAGTYTGTIRALLLK